MRTWPWCKRTNAWRTEKYGAELRVHSTDDGWWSAGVIDGFHWNARTPRNTSDEAMLDVTRMAEALLDKGDQERKGYNLALERVKRFGEGLPVQTQLSDEEREILAQCAEVLEGMPI